MKLQICRASGLPVKYEDIEAYKEAHRLLYDKIKVHVLGDGELMTQEEANRMNRLLDRLTKKALARFKVIDTLETKGTVKSWLELIEKHGPIALAKNAETGSLVAILMDAPWEN
jgi:hypothetical protein